MKDLTIKGTGNSRFLKSIENFKTQYPSYDDFAAALVAGTLPVDFNGLNPDGVEQLGTPLNKNTLLTDEVAEAIGAMAGADAPETVNEALESINSALAQDINDGFKVGDIRISKRNSLGGNYRLANGETFEPPDYPELANLVPRVPRLNLLASATQESTASYILDPSYTSGGGYYLISFGSTEGDSTSGYTTNHYIMYSKNIAGPYNVKKIGTTENAFSTSNVNVQPHHSVYVNGKFYILVSWLGIIFSASAPDGVWEKTDIKLTGGNALKVRSYSMFTYLDGKFVIAAGHLQYYTSDISLPWSVHNVASDSNDYVTLLIEAGGWYYQLFQTKGYYSTSVYRSKTLLGSYVSVGSFSSELPLDVATDGTTIYALSQDYDSSDHAYLHVTSPSDNSWSSTGLGYSGARTLSAGLKNQNYRNTVYACIYNSKVGSRVESTQTTGVSAPNGQVRIAVEDGRAYIFLLTKETNTSPIVMSVYSADYSKLPSVTIDNAYTYIKIKEGEE